MAEKTQKEKSGQKPAKEKVAQKKEVATKKDATLKKAAASKSHGAPAQKNVAASPQKAGSRVSQPNRKPMRQKTENSVRTVRKPVSFTLDAPRAGRVFLAACFNGWDPFATPLVRNDDGQWTCTLDIEPGEHQYRFVVDEEWQDDPCNSLRCSNEFGTENCVLIIED